LSTAWRSIPMPASIERLPRNSAGRPVPGNTPWYLPDTSGGQWTVRRSTELGEHLACPCQPGLGTPTFGSQCPQRQRDLMTQRRCSVCTVAMKPTSRVVFIGGPAAAHYLEPPTHPRCAAYALQVCPTLAEAGDEIELAITRTYTLRERRISLSASRERVHTVYAYGDPSARGVLDMYLAFPGDPRRSTARAWLRHGAPKL
jgi:hypothetical protein